MIKIHDRLLQYISLECRTAPRIWRLRGVPRLPCAPLVLDRPAAVAGPGGGRRRAVATAADRIAAQLGYCRFRPGRDDERSKLPGSRPFARSPTLSMPAVFARRAAVNGIPAQSTIFSPASLSPASLTANPECAVRPQFPSAVMITRFTCSFNVLGRGPARQCRSIGAGQSSAPRRSRAPRHGLADACRDRRYLPPSRREPGRWSA